MAVLGIHHAAKGFGGRVLFAGLHLELSAGRKAGIGHGGGHACEGATQRAVAGARTRPRSPAGGRGVRHAEAAAWRSTGRCAGHGRAPGGGAVRRRG